jgi:tRNA-splicing ligase RtcB
MTNKMLEFEKPFNVRDRIDYTEELLNVPIKMWLSRIDTGALDQLYNLARLPFVYKHIAVMPDAHVGYGMPIGGVLATKGYIIPNAVGVDIGCGMISVRTSLRHITRDTLKKILGDIRKLVPVGVGKSHKNRQSGMPIWNQKFVMESIIEREYEKAGKSLGTLGSGNHFIEIQKGSDGYIYVMIHSGSRNLGYKVAAHYNKLAVEANEKWCSSVPKNWQLAFLPIQNHSGIAYRNEMDYCVKYAYANRLLMMNRVMEAFKDHLDDITFYDNDLINIAHNYASFEHHFGQNVMVHRKGATAAYKDQLGIIPGSQGTSSFIVRGKGNRESFMSCSHGAGRVIGRKQAKKDLNLEDEIKILDDQGIIHGIRNTEDLEEAVSAYKDINDVMNHQKKLVSIVMELKPIAVIKG